MKIIFSKRTSSESSASMQVSCYISYNIISYIYTDVHLANDTLQKK
jgi:hypothetical protein